MQARRYLLGVTLAAMWILAAACAGNSAPGGSPGEMVGSYDQLVDALRSNGSTVDAAGAVSQPFFGPEGQVIRLDGQEVQVFEFATEGDAASAAETISPDGGSVGTSMVSWISVPHFYHAGKLVVLYVGEEESVIAALEGVFGPQIAGR